MAHLKFFKIARMTIDSDDAYIPWINPGVSYAYLIYHFMHLY